MKKLLLGILLSLMVWAGTLSAQVVEPAFSPTQTDYYSVLSASSENDDNYWVEIINRPSSDNYQNLYLYVDVIGIYLPSVIVYEVPQGSVPQPVQMQPDDIMIIWDEDATHGEDPPPTDFSFTGEIIEDPDSPFIRIRTNDTEEILNWSIHRVIEAGTMTINTTGENEHDIILLPEWYNDFIFNKNDNILDGECVSLGDEITYTICYKNESNTTFTNAKIVDYLPDGVTYPEGWERLDGNLNVIPADPNYDQINHTYTWQLDTLSPETDPNVSPICVSLDVEVNDYAEPGGILHNVVELIGAYQTEDADGDPISVEVVLAIDTEDTDVCCYGEPNIIFVDINATSGTDTGVSWANAYHSTDGLQKALNRAWNSACVGPFTIYIAQGTYLPGTSEYDSFELPDGCQVYGGFPTGGCDFAYRNTNKYKTILSGLLSDRYVYSVVKMGHESLINGTTITDGFDHNIYGEDIDFEVNNCVIKSGLGYGIYAEYGNVTIKSCMINNNGIDGIYHESVIGNNLDVSNSWIMRNNEHGMFCDGSILTAKNSIISESDLSEDGRAGIYIQDPPFSPVLHNLTISENKSVGLHFEDDQGSDPNIMLLDYPDVQNCIIFYNNDDGQQIGGRINPSFASYSCIQDCNDVNPNNNINTIPNFAYLKTTGEPDPNNFHLAYNSACKDMGNPNLIYSDQTDYDNEIRVVGTAVDMGADELYSCDGNYTQEEFANEFDWNADGIVNLKEFELFSTSWLSLDPANPAWSDPNYGGDYTDTYTWNHICNLDDTGNSQYIIDLADLTVFVNDAPWLWQACWYDTFTAAQTAGQTAMMSAPTMALESFSAVSSLNLDIESESLNMYDYYTNSELAQVVSDIYVIQYKVYELLDDPHNRKDKKDLQDMLDFFDDELDKIRETLQ